MYIPQLVLQVSILEHQLEQKSEVISAQADDLAHLRIHIRILEARLTGLSCDCHRADNSLSDESSSGEA